MTYRGSYVFLNGIDFPNQIVDAIKCNNLVVFAGAGTSVDKPTSLPDFENLAKEIAEGTGEIIGEKDSCEVFLGALKAKDVDVNQLAADILSGTCLEHNKLHETIVDLFNSHEDIKIVTTNYDQMFEQVIESRGGSPTVFNVPALPLGDDVNRIVHIHGNVENPKTLQYLMGHSDISVTLNTYTHVKFEDAKEEMARLKVI